MTRFETGIEYVTRYIGDHDLIITSKIIARTEKTVTALINNREQKTFRIKVWNGEEQFYPEGRFSFAPIMSASRIKAA